MASKSAIRSPAPMPKMEPIPIKTRVWPWPLRILLWLFTIRQWKLLEDWEFKLPPGEPIIVIPKDYEFDGASIPRIFWFVLAPTGLLLIPGLLHDYAYQHGYLLEAKSGGKTKFGENKGKSYWDWLFARVARRENGFFIIIYVAWFILFVFGWWSWLCYRRKDNKDEH